MRLLLTNDWHFAVRNPASRLDDYNAELFTGLDQIAQIVEKLHVRAVLVAGDLFHSKGRAPWPVVVQLLDWAQRLRRAGAEILVVAGNHDEVADRYESLPDTPFGALTTSGLFLDCSRRMVTVAGPADDACACWGVPWPDGGSPTAFATVPTEAQVVLAHAFATPEGGERWGQFCHRYDDLAKAAPYVRLWHFGHDHSDNGVVRLRNGAQVVNIGALSRGSVEEENLTRQVKVALVDTATWTVQQIGLRLPLASEIFDLEKRAALKAEASRLQAFVQQLASDVTTLFEVEYQRIFEKMPLDAVVRTRVQEYLTRAEGV